MDNNHLTGRLKRYATVSSAATSLAVRLLAERILGRTGNEGDQARSLTQALGNLKGPVMKIAQFLATVPDAVPDSYAKEFLDLQSQAPPMGWPFVKRRMRAELGPEWQAHFKEFSPQAAAAASLGQVHKARLLDGTLVACKLQYPDMQACVEADIQQLALALKLFETISPALKFHDIHQEIADRLREELDYRLEAVNLSIYGRVFKNTPWIFVPWVNPSLSTQRLLTMEWLQGEALKELKDLSQERRNTLAKRLFHAWYYPFYSHGLIHGDPHLGNYTFQSDDSLNLLDFGCIRKFPASFVQGVLKLFFALLENRPHEAVEAYEAWGFKDLTGEKIEALNLWARMLYEPLMDDRVRPIQEGHRGLKGRETAQKVHQELKRLGGVHPPREFVFMDRAAVGIGSAFMHLRAELNWHELFMEMIQGFYREKVEENQRLQGIEIL